LADAEEIYLKGEISKSKYRVELQKEFKQTLYKYISDKMPAASDSAIASIGGYLMAVTNLINWAKGKKKRNDQMQPWQRSWFRTNLK